MNNAKIEAALERIIHESPYNGPIVAQAYRDLLAGAKLFGVPASHYHRFLSLIEEEAAESGVEVLKELAEAKAQCVELDGLAAQKFNEGYDRAFAQIKATLSDLIPGSNHRYGADCPCGPTVEGEIVKHR